MDLDRQTLQKLKKYAQVFKEARDRNANESDTVLYLVKLFEEILGYDSLQGEISKEVAIKDRYCDFGIKIGGVLQFLIEAKSAGNKTLRDKDIEQAENYASRVGIRWVLLTNGIEWKMYHLNFNEGEGINHDEIFSFNFIDEIESAPAKVWELMGLLGKESLKKDALSDFLTHKKALAPSSLLHVLFSEDVLVTIRRELNRNSEVRLEISDVFEGLKNIVTKDALLSAGDISLRRKRKKRRKVVKVDETGKSVETEVEVEENEDTAQAQPPNSPGNGPNP